MALTVSLVPSGLHHAVTSGTIDIGASYGQVAAVAANQLMKLLLPFEREVYNKPGYQDQVYVVSKLNDASITAIRLDATQFESDPTTGASVLRLRVDVAAVPGDVLIWIESHHSTGR